MTDPVVHIQVDPTDASSTPSWFGEVAVVAHALQRYGVLGTIQERVRFVRARMGKYELIDFTAILIGYAVSGEPTLRAFCERAQPFASSFMALFGRADFPTPPTLSRYLAVLDQPCVEALRTLFLEDLLARSPFGTPPGGLWDLLGGQWLLVDVDGTKQAARQRALPATPDLPPAHRRFDQVCAPGHLGRKRGEVARTRTTILQAHTHQWLGTFGNPGNGQYRQELKRARSVIAAYAHALSFPLSHVVIRLDGLYGDAAPLADLLAKDSEEEAERPAVVVRGKAYHLLEQPAIKQRLTLPPDQVTVHPESGASRALYDCGPIQLAPAGPAMRMLLATHLVGSSRSPIGKVRDQTVYEQFFTTLPRHAFTPADVLDLYLHRGSFETVLADEDEEQAVDRWVSRTQWGQEFWQIINQWIWNLRLELGQHAQATTMRLAYSRLLDRPRPLPMMILLLLGRLLPFPQVLLLPLPEPLLLTPRLRRILWIGRRPTGHRTGRNPPLRMGFLVRRLPRSPMGRCAAQLAIRSLCKNAGQNATAPCACCMRPALAIAAPAPCANSVKNRAQLSNRDG